MLNIVQEVEKETYTDGIAKDPGFLGSIRHTILTRQVAERFGCERLVVHFTFMTVRCKSATIRTNKTTVGALLT